MKSHFPIINYFEKKHIIYADSAATTLKLKTVIDSVSNFYSFETSNVFRGLHLHLQKPLLRKLKCQEI